MRAKPQDATLSDLRPDFLVFRISMMRRRLIVRRTMRVQLTRVGTGLFHPEKTMESDMKNLFLAALAVLGLGIAVVPAYAAASHDDLSKATRMQQEGAIGQE
jgi:DNA-binding transcriptional LysR family regulator